jgi:hypothetical protein
MAAPTVLTGATRNARAGGLLLLACLAIACASPTGPGSTPKVQPLRISEVATAGDPTRRASTRLVLKGLAASPPEQGLTHYERAIKIDATNPYAYLALAAFEVQWGDLDRGLQSLEQSELLLDSQDLHSPRVEPHLVGLNGRAKLRGYDAGERRAGEALLDEARAMAPEVWGDGWLSVTELR